MGNVRRIIAGLGLTIVAIAGTVVGPALARSGEPLETYPRRPGAKVGEVEARVDTWVPVDTGRVVLRQPGVVTDVPPGVGLGLFDGQHLEGFAPKLSEPDDRVLHVRLEYETGADLIPAAARCDLTAGADGAIAQMWEWDDSHLALEILTQLMTSSVPLPTTSLAPPQAPYDFTNSVEFWLPIGARTGRFYVACSTGSARIVWGFDVA